MRAALTNSDPFDDCTADWTGFTTPAIDPEVVLELPAAVHPVDAGPVAADPLFQYGHHGSPACHSRALSGQGRGLHRRIAA